MQTLNFFRIWRSILSGFLFLIWETQIGTPAFIRDADGTTSAYKGPAWGGVGQRAWYGDAAAVTVVLTARFALPCGFAHSLGPYAEHWTGRQTNWTDPCRAQPDGSGLRRPSPGPGYSGGLSQPGARRASRRRRRSAGRDWPDVRAAPFGHARAPSRARVCSVHCAPVPARAGSRRAQRASGARAVGGGPGERRAPSRPRDRRPKPASVRLSFRQSLRPAGAAQLG